MFENRVALITGGSAGIGFAVARKWVAAGGLAALAARTRARLDEAVAALGGGTKAAAFAIDVGDLAALEKLPAQVVSRFGRLDAVINNAGTHHRGPLIDRTPPHLPDTLSTTSPPPLFP